MSVAPCSSIYYVYTTPDGVLSESVTSDKPSGDAALGCSHTPLPAQGTVGGYSPIDMCVRLCFYQAETADDDKSDLDDFRRPFRFQ